MRRIGLIAVGCLAMGLAGCRSKPPARPAPAPVRAPVAVPAEAPRPAEIPPPRILVLFQVQGTLPGAAADAEALISRRLMQDRIPMIDQAVVRANVQKLQTLMSASGDEQGAAALGAQLGADIVVRGSADVRALAQHIADSNLQSYQAQVNLQAAATDNGAVLASTDAAATALALDAAAGGAKAVQSAAARALDSLLATLLPVWRDQVRTGRLRAVSEDDVSIARALSAPETSVPAALPAPPQAGYAAPVAAIWRLTPQGGIPADWMAPVTEKLHASILKSGWYRLVTRDDMSKLLAEHNVQMSDICDSAEKAVEFGKILSAEKLLIGTVGRLGTTFQVVLKQVDVESGEIERVGQAEGRGGADALLGLAAAAAADLLRSPSTGARTPEQNAPGGAAEPTQGSGRK